MNKEEINKLKIVVEKEKNSLIGRKEVICFDGIVSVFSSAAIIGSGIYLTKTIPKLSYSIINQGIPQNILLFTKIGVSCLLIPLASYILTLNIPRFKEDIRMLKYEKEWLLRDKRKLALANFEESHKQKIITKITSSK